MASILFMVNALIKKTGIYAIGNLASKVTAALIIPIYGWFVAAEALGYYDYYLTLMTMLSPLCFMALWEAILRFTIAETDNDRLQKAVSTVFAILSGSTILITAIALIASIVFPRLVYAIVSVALMTIVYGLAQSWQYFARSFRQSKLYALSGIVAALVNFGLILVLVCIMDLQLMGLVVSYVVSQLAVMIIIESKVQVINRFRLNQIDREAAARFLRFSIPMAFNLLLGAFLAGFGRLLVTNVLGAEANGLYAFAMKFGALVTAVGSIFSMAVIEEAVLRIGKPGHEGFIGTVANYSMLLLVSLAAIALPLIQLLWPMLAGQEYAASLHMVPAFLLYGSLTVEATVVGNVFNIVNKTHLGALSMLVGCVICALLSFLAINQFGESAVAWSTAVGSFALLAMRYVLGRKYIAYTLRPSWVIFLSVALAVEVCIFFCDWEGSLVGPRVIWLAITAAVFLPIAFKGIKGLSSIKDIA